MSVSKMCSFSSQISFPTNLKLTTHLFSLQFEYYKVFNHQMSIFVNKDCPLDHKTFDSMSCQVHIGLAVLSLLAIVLCNMIFHGSIPYYLCVLCNCMPIILYVISLYQKPMQRS